MENSYYDIEDIKERFALLISLLQEVHLSLEYINEVIVRHPFFSCFEKNEMKEFMTISFEAISEKIFGKEAVFDYSAEHINAFYWAGLTAMNIMLNLRIPLKRVLLIYPLKDIVKDYEVYHEMHVEQILNRYKDFENERNLLKVLASDARYKMTTVGALSGIPMPTIRKLEKSNQYLFATSGQNQALLARIFNVDIDVFLPRSLCSPISPSLFQNESIRAALAKAILSYYSKQNSDYLVTLSELKDDGVIKNVLQGTDVIVELSHRVGIAYLCGSMIKKRYLTKTEFLLLYNQAMDEARNTICRVLF